jgi:hypothetical protein
MEVHFHVQLASDQMSLIHTAGSGAAHIKLLQRDDVGLTRGDHLSNSFRREQTIEAYAAMYVIRYNAKQFRHLLSEAPI